MGEHRKGGRTGESGYRGGHTGKGGSHGKGGCMILLLPLVGVLVAALASVLLS